MTDHTEWQPIETAPKDGTRILVGRVGHPWTFVVFWDEHWGKGGWYYSSGAMDWFAEPTHWMPLPLPPER